MGVAEASSPSAMGRVAKFINDLLTFEVDEEQGRVLEVSIGGELNKDSYCDNSITTHKYNALTLIPKSLFEQFRRTANQYFLLIGLLMIIGTYTDLFYSPLLPWSTITPLSLILAITCLLYTSPSPRDKRQSRMPSSA